MKQVYCFGGYKKHKTGNSVMEIALFCDGRTTLKRPGKRLVVGQSLNLCHLSTATGNKLQPHWVEAYMNSRGLDWVGLYCMLKEIFQGQHGFEMVERL